MKFFNQRKAAAALPMVLLIGGVIVEIAIAGAFIAYYLSQSGFSIKMSAEAYAAAQAGVQDVLIRIIREKSFNPDPNPYILTVGNREAQITVCKDVCVGTDKYEITSLGIAFNQRRQLRAVISINPFNGQAFIESIQETIIAD